MSSFEIYEFPIISTFQIKVVEIIHSAIKIVNNRKASLLFLYLNNLKYTPFLLKIFTLHFVFLVIDRNFLKSFIAILNLTIPPPIVLISHIFILLILQRLIYLSVKNPSISTSTVPLIFFIFDIYNTILSVF